MAFALTAHREDVYVNFNTDRNSRHWDDAVKYGFLSGGGTSRNRRAMESLQPGERVWVNIRGSGFVGVGRVLTNARPALDFRINNVPILSRTRGDYRRQWANDPDKCEYFVSVRWLDTLPLDNGIKEKGLFGNQNTVCRPTSSKWRHTVDRLKRQFLKWNQG